MTVLANRINDMAESATLAMASKAREFKSRGINVINLSLGEPDFPTPKHIQEGAKQAIDEGKYFGYPPVPGYSDLREVIAEKFNRENNIPYKAENIVVSNGAKQSIANVMCSLINPGDEVVVFSPFWVTYSALIELNDGIPIYVDGDIKNNFKATAEQLKAAITPKTKAIIFSSPCNPTGSVFLKEELEAIAKIVLEYEHITVIADEIYEHINYTGKHQSIAAIDGMVDRTVTVNGMAKGFAMTGWRVGYIGAPLWIAKGCTKIQGQITSANCSIAQRATWTALTSDLEPTIEMSKAYLNRRNMVYDLLKVMPEVRVNLPDGAFYFFPDISHYFGKSDGNTTIDNASDLCIYILENAHVSVVTGQAFGAPKCIRISYAASDSELIEAMDRIKKTLMKLK